MSWIPHLFPAAVPLAQNGAGSVLGWSLLLVILLMVMFFAIGWLRKWVKREDADDSPRIGFTLGDLRRLRDEGQLTEEEFERARAQMIAATQKAAERAAQQAAEAAKGKGVTSPQVTDIDELRERARRHRNPERPANGSRPPDQGPPAAGH